ncbi:hypothetical protein L2E82_49963 [Cichorium intybus]|nr:hypothetical protein L2E82_49963 [Cichorium intybus]
MERRITRSQSTRGRKTEVRQAWYEKETSSVESSFVSVGITNRIDEIGSLCGFNEAKQALSGKSHRGCVGKFEVEGKHLKIFIVMQKLKVIKEKLRAWAANRRRENMQKKEDVWRTLSP